MPKHLLRAATVLCLALAALPAAAQYQTPTVDGTVGAGEYANHSGDWSMTWDATYLYIAKTNFISPDHTLLVYLDTDPLSTPTAGTHSNGNLTSPGDHEINPALPFRADARAYIARNLTTSLRTRDGSGSWTAANTDSNDVSSAVNGSTGEMRIRWGAIPGLSGVPSSFAWLAYTVDEDLSPDSVNATIPSSNPTGSTANPSYIYYYTIFSTANGTSTNPFVGQQSTWQVTSNADSGANTLRDTITSAVGDTTSLRRYIVFNTIDNNTIITSSDLPAITQPVTIDGTTAPGYSSAPVLTVQGFSTSSLTDHGIRLTSTAGCVIRGLALVNHGVGILITNGLSHTIAGNYIGVTTSGTTALSNDIGVHVSGATGCTIGGTTSSDRNVISGNSLNGIRSSNHSSSLTIQGNYIGTTSSGNAGLGNGDGIALQSAASTLIGGTSAGAGNVISGNGGNGILSTTTPDVSIYGNFIGVGADGTTALGNGEEGVLQNGGARMTIGATTATAGNTISHNSAGVNVLTQSDSLSVRGNAMTGNANGGVSVGGSVVQPAPVVTAAVISNTNLTITFSLSSNSISHTTQSMQLDLYDADSASAAQGKLYRASSPCYSGSSLNNQAWSAGSGYSGGYQFVLIATSYYDANCTTPGDGSSSNTAKITASTVSAPTNVVAMATGTSTAMISWTAASGATSYEIWRSSLNSAYGLAGTSNGTTFGDSGLSPNTTYLYKVKAVYTGGTSDYSSLDATTTIVFTDPTLTSVTIKAVHINELRTAINAMRASLGLGDETFTDSTLTVNSTNVKAVHLTELRSALDAVRLSLGLPGLTYTDPTITTGVTTVKAAHVTELRAGTQ